MKNEVKRKLFIACLIFLGIGIAYSGELIVGLLMGVVATVILAAEEFKLFGEEEESEEEEL